MDGHHICRVRVSRTMVSRRVGKHELCLETGARRCMHLSLACRLRSCHDYKNWEWDTELTTWLAWLLQSPKGVPGGLAVRAVELHAATTRL